MDRTPGTPAVPRPVPRFPPTPGLAARTVPSLALPTLFLPMLILTALVGCGPREPQEPEPLVVFAAASLSDLAADLGTAFEEHRPGTEVVFNFAGSNTLAQQIEAAPRAGVFLSADERWVRFLVRAGRTVSGSRRAFLTNSLVVIGHARAPWSQIDPRDLAGLPYRHLVVAEPSAVPAGRYARSALEAIPLEGSNDEREAGASLWRAVEDRLVPAVDVRAALALVESDPEILGITYRTDALASDAVRVLCELPLPPDHAITYWAVRIDDGEAQSDAAAARDFLEFLAGPETRRIAESHGFGVPERASGSGVVS